MSRFVCSVLVVCLAGWACPSAKAVLVVSYTASAAPGASPDANGGADEVWTFSPSGGSAGNFLGDSGGNGDGAGAGAGTTAWGLYADAFNSATASAGLTPLVGRPLSLAGDSIALQFDNGWFNPGASAGIRFRDSSGAVAASLSFTDGQTGYALGDASGVSVTGVGFTDDGFDTLLELTSDSGDFTFTFAGSSFTGALAGDADIASIDVFADGPGSGSTRDVFFNNLQITAVPEPTAALFGAVLTAGLGLTVARRGS